MKQNITKIQPKVEKPFFKGFKGFMKATRKKTKFYYIGKHFRPGSLILSNHESTKGPLSWDFYCDQPVRLLGTEEMNSGLKRMYKYQTEIYYHKKKHWNLFVSRMFCLLASPLTNCFYKGLNLISIRNGFEFKHTINDVYTSLVEFKENIVLFPEDSETGYHPQLTSFKNGFLVICNYCYKKGYDVPIVVGYYNRKLSTIVVDEPILYSTLIARFKTKDEISEFLKDRCNELGRMTQEDLDKLEKKSH